MLKYRAALPTFAKGIFVSYTGIETDLIFNRGIDLPGFASYPLLETKEGREMLYGYFARLIDMARKKRVGVLLESLTWVANRDRGAAIGYPEEAIGIIRAGQRFEIPVVIAFTVEKDGRLPIGMPLKEAIECVDDATDGGTAYFLINCAHPDHFSDLLEDAKWIHRLRGVVANASRFSHAELDESEELDEGDPVELGELVGAIFNKFPHFNIAGGCCGTDMRHLRRIIEKAPTALI